MAFEQNKPKGKQYSISLVTPNGNTVGFINLAPSFIKAVIGKDPDHITAFDIEHVNNNDFNNYVKSLSIVVADSITPEKIEAKDY